MNGRQQVALWSLALLVSGCYCLMAISAQSNDAGEEVAKSAAVVEQEALQQEAVPPSAELRWWKGNLHTHTYWSDGDDFPEMVAEWYRTHGYNFLALSDHNVLSEGIRWVKLTDLEKRRGDVALDKYLKRFGPNWIETRGKREDGSLEVRLSPSANIARLSKSAGGF
jgi:hypothetical protein